MKQDELNPDSKIGMKKSMLFGLLIGFILGVVDLYLGLQHAIFSARTYIGFFVGYIFMFTFVSMIFNLILNYIQKRFRINLNPFVMNFIFFLFLYDYVILNVRLTGWFNLLNLRAIGINIILIASVFILGFLAHKVESLRKKFSSISDLIQLSLVTFMGTALFNILKLNFADPPDNKLNVILLTVLLMIIPYFSLALKLMWDAILIKLKFPAKYQYLAGLGIALLIFILLPQVLKKPSMAQFFNEEYNEAAFRQNSNKPNVIWIVLDTARKDQFSCYGNDRITTPNIDRFAQDGVMFTNYISTAPWTIPSHASMFTGMYTSKHGARFAKKNENGLFKFLPLEAVTIAEVLQKNGYNTGAVISNTILSSNANFDQGFNFYYSKVNEFSDFFWGLFCGQVYPNIWNDLGLFRINVYQLAPSVNKTAIRWVEENETNPFFLFLNYMEPHTGGKYFPGKYDDYFGIDWGDWTRMYNSLDVEAIVYKEKSLTDQQKQVNKDWLDNKMLFLDNHVGVLLDKLKKLNLYDNSIIAVLSDHGHLFGEHYSFGHTMELYNELIHVPLIIKYQKQMKRTGTSQKYIQTVDLMPEILKLMGLEIPAKVQGQDFENINHQIVSELFQTKNLDINVERYARDIKAIYDDQNQEIYKYIKSTNNKNELFNLTNDSLESQNIVSESPDLEEIFNRKILNWMNSFEPIKESLNKDGNALDEKTRQKLRALGYIK